MEIEQISENKVKITMKNHKCSTCGGTGLYKGMAEKGLCAVLCRSCKGKGMTDVIQTVEHIPLETKERMDDVKRVFRNCYGFAHTHENVKNDRGDIIKFSEGGVVYEDWFTKDEQPQPVKDLYCPYAWTDQRLQSSGEDVNNLYKYRCRNGVNWGGRISHCKLWSEKHICWKIFEGELDPEVPTPLAPDDLRDYERKLLISHMSRTGSTLEESLVELGMFYDIKKQGEV